MTLTVPSSQPQTSQSDPDPVLGGILLVHTEDRTVVYEGATWSESELRCLSQKIDDLLSDITSGALTDREEDWGQWFLEVCDSCSVILSGIPTDLEKLRKYQRGCHDAIAILDAAPNDTDECALAS